MGNQLALQGTFTALVTPFAEDGSAVDLESWKSLIDFQLSAGINGLVVCGSTGEAATIRDDEYSAVVRSAVAHVRGRVPVIAGIGGSSTARAVEVAKVLEDTAIDGILLVAPPYNKPPQEGIVAHFLAVKAATSRPIVAYNVPGRTSVNILPETIARLTNEGVIAGLKDATGSIAQLLDTVALVGRRISIVSGEDGLIQPLMACGGTGVISVISNVWPKETLAITDAARAGRWEDALQAQIRALPLVRAMFCETNPIPVKTALALKGVIRHATVRLPLVQAQSATVERIKALL